MPPPGTIATVCWHGSATLGNAIASSLGAGPPFHTQRSRSCTDRAKWRVLTLLRSFSRDDAERLNDPVDFRYTAERAEGGDQYRQDLTRRRRRADHAHRLQDSQSRIGNDRQRSLLPDKRLPAEHAVDGRENRRVRDERARPALSRHALATQKRAGNELQHVACRVLLAPTGRDDRRGSPCLEQGVEQELQYVLGLDDIGRGGATRQRARQRLLRHLVGGAGWRQAVGALKGAHRGGSDRAEFAVDVTDFKSQLREARLQLPHPISDRSRGQRTIIDRHHFRATVKSNGRIELHDPFQYRHGTALLVDRG